VEANEVNDIVSADLAGPYDLDFGNSTKRYYILVLVDHFSKFISTYAIANKSSNQIAKIIKQHFFTYGAPKMFYTDDEIDLKAKEIMKLLEFFKTTKHSSAPHHKTSLRENAVKKVKHALISMSNEKTNWKKLLPFVTNQLNNQIDTTTKFSPSLLFFKRSTEIIHTPHIQQPPFSTRDWEIIRNIVLENNGAAKKREKFYFDKFTHQRTYEVNDRVIIYKEKSTRFDFKFKWSEPATITEVCSNNIFKVRDQNGKVTRQYGGNIFKIPANCDFQGKPSHEIFRQIQREEETEDDSLGMENQVDSETPTSQPTPPQTPVPQAPSSQAPAQSPKPKKTKSKSNIQQPQQNLTTPLQPSKQNKHSDGNTYFRDFTPRKTNRSKVNSTLETDRDFVKRTNQEMESIGKKFSSGNFLSNFTECNDNNHMNHIPNTENPINPDSVR